MFVFILSALSIRKTFRPNHCIDADLIYNEDYFRIENYPMPFEVFQFSDNNGYAGKGHFSVVRKAKLADGRMVAVKEYKIFSRNSLIRELKILNALKVFLTLSS